jgi:hypothetical protein
MTHINRKSLVLGALTAAALFVSTAGVAQERASGGGTPCPKPVTFVINKTSGTTNVNKADIPASFRANQMTYDDKGVDKHFSDTIAWDLPREQCCAYSEAVVTWTVKNNGNNGLQGNDSTGLWFNGSAIVSHLVGGLAPGATKTFTHALTMQQIQQGRITLLAQDDTAVVKFEVRIRGCCLTPGVSPAGMGKG